LTGYTLDDLNAMSPAEFLAIFHPEDRAAVQALLAETPGLDIVAGTADDLVFDCDGSIVGVRTGSGRRACVRGLRGLPIVVRGGNTSILSSPDRTGQDQQLPYRSQPGPSPAGSSGSTPQGPAGARRAGGRRRLPGTEEELEEEDAVRDVDVTVVVRVARILAVEGRSSDEEKVEDLEGIADVRGAVWLRNTSSNPHRPS
jgi:hypothetical protein